MRKLCIILVTLVTFALQFSMADYDEITPAIPKIKTITKTYDATAYNAQLKCVNIVQFKKKIQGADTWYAIDMTDSDSQSKVFYKDLSDYATTQVNIKYTIIASSNVAQ